MDPSFFHLLFLLVSLSICISTSVSLSNNKNSSSSCPMDLGYVSTISWPSSDCNISNPQSNNSSSENICCVTLLRVYGIALAQRLKETSQFQLPDLLTSVSCLNDYQSNLSSLSLPSNLTSLCFDPLQFVISPNICASIQSTQDWVAKLGPTTALDVDCHSDLSNFTSCDACVSAIIRVHSYLIAIDGNISHSKSCFYFTLLYAAGIVNQFGPKSTGSVSCILRHPITALVGSKSNKKKKSTLVFGLTGGLSAVVVMSCLTGLYFWWDKKWRKKTRNLVIGSNPRQFSEEDKEQIDVPFFDLESILAATDSFSDANKLGEGGFGPVYKGTFPGGKEIAVKRLSTHSMQGLDEHKNEVVLIAKLQHRNLVKLLGYCIEGDENILLYEYMPNKSLDAFIFDQTLCVLLNWEKRFEIILGIARGLLYLHQDSRLRVIHRDLKVSNILLDEDMNPKISDFGLARIVGGRETEANTKRVVGTYGYMSPEYALEGLFSIKSDVFSFGVVVLEIISGKKNIGFYKSQQDLNLLGYAWRLLKEDNSLGIMDQKIVESCNKNEALKCIIIGLLCVQEDPSDRPNMSNIVVMLGSSDIENLPSPKKPAFVARTNQQNMSNNESRLSHQQIQSNNEITLSVVKPR